MWGNCVKQIAKKFGNQALSDLPLPCKRKIKVAILDELFRKEGQFKVYTCQSLSTA